MGVVNWIISGSCTRIFDFFSSSGGVSSVSPVGVQHIKINKIDNLTFMKSEIFIDLDWFYTSLVDVPPISKNRKIITEPTQVKSKIMMYRFGLPPEKDL